jgi:hypothetical protein
MIASVMLIRESTPGRIAPMPREAPMGTARVDHGAGFTIPLDSQG